MRRLSLAAVTLVLSLALAARPQSRDLASADGSTPLPSTPTAGITAVVEPSTTTTALTPSTAVRDRPGAGVTAAEGPPAPTATASPIPETSARTQVSQLPVTDLAPVPNVAGPTPDQLRLDALLRWGNHVPASVHRWAFLIVPAARKYGVDPNLVAAVMTMESNGDPMAESSAGAHGLMQILHGPWSPKTNVYTGVRMLADLYTEFGSWPLALAGYNAGPAAVVGANGIPPIQETRDYVVVVTYLWDLYGHHPLSDKRRQLYRSTLRDLSRFKDQRKKVGRLARAANVALGASAFCRHSGCPAPDAAVPPSQLDPFWPDGSVPDPLQRVTPFRGATN